VNLMVGCLAISMMIPATTVTNEFEALVTVTGQKILIAVEQREKYSHQPNHSAASQVFEGQQKGEQQPLKSLDQWPMECEGAATRLDFAVISTQKLEGAYLILIARLGSGEISRSLNQTRLAGAEQYVLRRGSDLKYVLAQGTRVKGLGRLEIYVGGKLAEIMPLRKNAKGYCIGRDGR
jgi:hypothetical protein